MTLVAHLGKGKALYHVLKGPMCPPYYSAYDLPGVRGATDTRENIIKQAQKAVVGMPLYRKPNPGQHLTKDYWMILDALEAEVNEWGEVSP